LGYKHGNYVGDIDEVRSYSRALTPAEIAALTSSSNSASRYDSAKVLGAISRQCGAGQPGKQEVEGWRGSGIAQNNQVNPERLVGGAIVQVVGVALVAVPRLRRVAEAKYSRPAHVGRSRICGEDAICPAASREA